MEKDNLNRQYIMNYLRLHKTLTISQLSKMVSISRPTIYLHLKNLEKKGLVRRTKDPKKKGAPVTIHIIEDSVVKEDKKALLEFLKIIESNEDTTQFSLKEMKLARNMMMAYAQATFKGLVDKKIFLTEKGKKFLEDNKNESE